MIESGPRWVNILMYATEIKAGSYLLTSIRRVILAGTFGTLFSQTPAEMNLFKQNKFSTAYAPLLLASEAGYNGGNWLSCLYHEYVDMFISGYHG